MLVGCLLYCAWASEVHALLRLFVGASGNAEIPHILLVGCWSVLERFSRLVLRRIRSYEDGLVLRSMFVQTGYLLSLVVGSSEEYGSGSETDSGS